MLSSEFIKAGFFKPRKADCERRLRACDEQDRNAVHREQPSNLRTGKLVSSTKKAYHAMRGAVWGGNKFYSSILGLKYSKILLQILNSLACLFLNELDVGLKF